MNKEDDELAIFYDQASKVSVKKGKIQNTKKQSNIEAKTFKDVKGNEIQKTVAMISMKAFIFNFNKFYREKTRIRNLLSEASAKQRNISLKIYLRNHFLTYRDIKNMLLEIKIDEVRTLRRFEDLAFRNLSFQEDTRIYVRSETTNQLAIECKLALEDLSKQKNSAFYEKRVLTNFLVKLFNSENYTPVGYLDLSRSFRGMQSDRTNYLKKIGEFIKGFLSINKQDTFKLIDIAQYLYEHKYRRVEIDIIMRFISKLKNLINTRNGLPKTNQIDGDRSYKCELVTICYNIEVEKEQMFCQIVGTFMNNIRNLINQQIKVDIIERVRIIMELNLVSDYMIKYFRDLDDQIENQLNQLNQISELIQCIDKLNLPTKQDQLEVIFGFILRISKKTINDKLTTQLQQHNPLLDELQKKYEADNDHKRLRLSTKKNEEFIEIDADGSLKPKQLYNEDYLENGEEVFSNPYRVEYADQPVRQPKLYNLERIKPKFENQAARELEEAEDEINKLVQHTFEASDFPPQNLSEPQIQQKQNCKETGLFYEMEFERQSGSNKAQTKEQMILTLQEQIISLRKEVELSKQKQSEK